MIPDRSSPSRVRCAASRPGRLRADPGDVAVYEGKGMSRRPPAQISEMQGGPGDAQDLGDGGLGNLLLQE